MQTKVQKAVWTESVPADRNVGSHLQHKYEIDIIPPLLYNWQRVGTGVLSRAFSECFDIFGNFLISRAFLSHWTAPNDVFT